ncbi:PEP-CTERM sorting domain-containing protein [Roseateles oligotrophus]|uniref:PEP-CTERM sorting domain-containing protein n=1 Tax=Roseateles oligotrophus TaxID=1769250 RepID=A0ABT2Y8L6_9BURK|nr:PEP-CTERM sorting domain-containing protein [Roseateles oligotrophus]MCV2366640.1 PEP-CTERM sorting domain-containing protein [Roseateles oligotrophus]
MKRTLRAGLLTVACITAMAATLPAWAESCHDSNFSSLAAADCRGSQAGFLSGNASEISYLSSQWVGQWAYAGSSADIGNGPFTQNPQVMFSGLLSFDTPISGDFIIGMEVGEQHSFYLFHAPNGLTSVTFDSTEGVGTDPQGNPLPLTHATLYTPSPVPEPASYALLLAGLGTVGFVSARARQGRN